MSGLPPFIRGDAPSVVSSPHQSRLLSVDLLVTFACVFNGDYFAECNSASALDQGLGLGEGLCLGRPSRPPALSTTLSICPEPACHANPVKHRYEDPNSGAWAAGPCASSLAV